MAGWIQILHAVVNRPPNCPTLASHPAGTIIATQGATVFRVSAGSEVTNLGTFGDSISIQVNSINASGAFAGTGLSPLGRSRPFRFVEGGYQDLLQAEATTSSEHSEAVANDINDAGQVAGFAQEGKINRATIWFSPTVRTDLTGPEGHSTRALGINSAGAVCGEVSANVPDGTSRACAWFDNTLVDVNQATNSGALGLKSAKAISDSGRILAVSVVKGELKFFVLIPEATTPGGLPDLTGMLGPISKKTTGRGDRARVQLSGTVKVSNIGTSATKKTTDLRVFRGPRMGASFFVKQFKVSKLKPGQSRIIRYTFKLLPRTSTEALVLGARVDSQGQIEEQSDSNNEVFVDNLP